jgi:predicted metal-dependent HD superfamily phosphohydrolase
LERKCPPDKRSGVLIERFHCIVTRFGTLDEHYMLDLDMSILGQEWSVYKTYAANIRREYCHIPLEEYCEKRAKILELFLNGLKIYCTAEFHKLYESQARDNIRREIEVLKTNSICNI